MIYLDNAATTRMAPQVREAMLPCLSERFGNPSSLYSLGTKSRETVDEARKAIGQILGADGEEILRAAARKPITGRSNPLPWIRKKEGDISSPQRLNTMRCCIPAGIWRSRGTR